MKDTLKIKIAIMRRLWRYTTLIDVRDIMAQLRQHYPKFEQIIKRRPITFRQFVEDNKTAFA